ncbi:hypothetical protein AaE_007112 [Aphanomyces astaci]|uniref:PWWP domain-containing protein n=1 Tax=Aphanomyces astaci TaxID=112090 RepID=A0A6A5AC85_APHAT|nr:hypothetical protein AaE_007112 [Aphanomyces astaci]
MDSPVPGDMDSPPPALHVESPSGVPDPAANNTLPDQVTAPSYPIRTSSAIEPAMTLLVEAPVPHAFAVNDTLSTVHAAQRVEEAEDQSTIRTSDDDGRPTRSDAIGQDDDGAAQPFHSQYDLVDCIGWARAPKLPWWPVYICDPDHIPEDLKLMGTIIPHELST